MGLTVASMAPKFFNTPLEAALRASFVLEAFAPTCFDLSDLSLLDYFVVHTADIGGPTSLHPDIDGRTGEFYVRRQVVREGILLLQKAHLVEQMNLEQGVYYRAIERCGAMIGLMSSPYNKSLNDSALWLASIANERGTGELLELLRAQIGRYDHEFERGQ